jgi:hypothetical protein
VTVRCGPAADEVALCNDCIVVDTSPSRCDSSWLSELEAGSYKRGNIPCLLGGVIEVSLDMAENHTAPDIQLS